MAVDFRKSCLWFLVPVALLAGCGSPATPPAEDASDAASSESTADETPADEAVETAAIPNNLPEAKVYEAGEQGVTRTSSPAEVCRAFVHSLHERNITSAERLLTLASRITIHDQDLELDAIAGENAQYVIGDAKYATQLKQLAYVDCHVSELTDAGELNFVVSWMLKPEAGYGWRVFGMVMQEDGKNHILNFENPEHAEVVNSIYTNDAKIDGPAVRQAEAGSETTRIQ